MTPKVVTLWYRSPEILLKQAYSKSADVWGLGCIIGEFLNKGHPILAGNSEIN